MWGRGLKHHRRDNYILIETCWCISICRCISVLCCWRRQVRNDCEAEAWSTILLILPSKKFGIFPLSTFRNLWCMYVLTQVGDHNGWAGWKFYDASLALGGDLVIGLFVVIVSHISTLLIVCSNVWKVRGRRISEHGMSCVLRMLLMIKKSISWSGLLGPFFHLLKLKLKCTTICQKISAKANLVVWEVGILVTLEKGMMVIMQISGWLGWFISSGSFSSIYATQWKANVLCQKIGEMGGGLLKNQSGKEKLVFSILKKCQKKKKKKMQK